MLNWASDEGFLRFMAANKSAWSRLMLEIAVKVTQSRLRSLEHAAP